MILNKLQVHDHWTRQQLEELQRRQLRSLVDHAVRHSQFYRDLYRDVDTGRGLVLQDLPVITKAVVMENFDRLVTDPRLRLSDLEAHIGQLTRDEYYLGEYRVLTTAGSSGLRGVFVFNRREWSTVLAAAFRVGIMMGLSLRFPKRWKVSWIGTDTPMHVSARISESSDIGQIRTQRLLVTSPLEQMVDELNLFQPESLFTYPSIASLLAIEQLEGRLHIHPQVVETGAEVRTEQMEQNIRRAWSVAPFNVYGTTEGGPCNVDCSYHRGIHVFEDLVLMEVVDERNQAVPDGLPGSKVLITNLFNFTQPLIRYEVTDMLTISPEPCPCGRPFRLISKIEGRSDDVVYLPGNQGRTVPVHPIHFHEAVGEIQEINEFRFVHEDNVIRISLVLRGGTSQEEVRERLTSNLTARLESLGAICPNIDIRFLDGIERNPKTMGKLKLVESKRGEHNAAKKAEE
jgi:putative adenylate-forming enzyme